jgi:hypothetical protein
MLPELFDPLSLQNRGRRPRQGRAQISSWSASKPKARHRFSHSRRSFVSHELVCVRAARTLAIALGVGMRDSGSPNMAARNARQGRIDSASLMDAPSRCGESSHRLSRGREAAWSAAPGFLRISATTSGQHPAPGVQGRVARTGGQGDRKSF